MNNDRLPNIHPGEILQTEAINFEREVILKTLGFPTER